MAGLYNFSSIRKLLDVNCTVPRSNRNSREMRAFYVLLLCAAVCAGATIPQEADDDSDLCEEFEKRAAELREMLALEMAKLTKQFTSLLSELEEEAEKESALESLDFAYHAEDPTRQGENFGTVSVPDVGFVDSVENVDPNIDQPLMDVASRRRRSAESLLKERLVGTTFTLKNLGLALTIHKVPSEGEKDAPRAEAHARKRRSAQEIVSLTPGIIGTPNSNSVPATQLAIEVPPKSAVNVEGEAEVATVPTLEEEYPEAKSYPTKGHNAPQGPSFPSSFPEQYPESDFGPGFYPPSEPNYPQAPSFPSTYPQPNPQSGEGSFPTKGSAYPQVPSFPPRYPEDPYFGANPFLNPDLGQQFGSNYPYDDFLSLLFPDSFEHTTRFGHHCTCSKGPSANGKKDQHAGGSGQGHKKAVKGGRVPVEPSKKADQAPVQPTKDGGSSSTSSSVTPGTSTTQAPRKVHKEVKVRPFSLGVSLGGLPFPHVPFLEGL